LHGSADSVAGGLLGSEPALLDPGEERHEKEPVRAPAPGGCTAYRQRPR
jgi:hypothetical protein